VSNELRIMTLLAEGNPATELPPDAWSDPIAHLTAIERRSSEMTMLEPKTSPEEIRRPFPTTTYVAAAVAVVVLGMGLFWINNATDEAAPAGATSITDDATAPSAGMPWLTFVSERYGYSIEYPPDWTVEPADHDWTLAKDAGDWLSTGQDVFYSPSRDVRVSAWAVGASTVEETWTDVEAWVVEEYCPQTNDPSCSRVHDRAVQLCIEVRDCHPGLLVPFQDDVQAFLRGGIADPEGGNVVIVAVWRAESHPSVAPYGGSRRLLEGFLSTMDVCVKQVAGTPAGQFACRIPSP
jgi:hypothetical protein